MINGGGSSPAPDSNTLTEERRSLLAKTRMINSSKIRTQDGHSITYSAGVEIKYTPAWALFCYFADQFDPFFLNQFVFGVFFRRPDWYQIAPFAWHLIMAWNCTLFGPSSVIFKVLLSHVSLHLSTLQLSRVLHLFINCEEKGEDSNIKYPYRWPFTFASWKSIIKSCGQNSLSTFICPFVVFQTWLGGYGTGRYCNNPGELLIEYDGPIQGKTGWKC